MMASEEVLAKKNRALEVSESKKFDGKDTEGTADAMESEYGGSQGTTFRDEDDSSSDVDLSTPVGGHNSTRGSVCHAQDSADSSVTFV